MADFGTALKRTLDHEGGYVNHSKDPGGETYMGIARNRHPQWEGWERIDKYKKSPAFPGAMDRDHALKGWVEDFYRNEFWKPIAGDEIKSQDTAGQLFDIAVNMGVRRAGKFLQIALNVLNREEKLYPNIEVDGRIGPETLKTLKRYQEWEPPAHLIKLLIIQRGAYYIDIVQRREASEAFLRGWLMRVGIRV